MDRYLILLRHAKSSWADPSLRDHERPLNKRGLRDAPDMGRRLAARQERPELIISSDAVRALDQAEQIAEKAGDSYVTVERLSTNNLRTVIIRHDSSSGKGWSDKIGHLIYGRGI